MAQIKFSKHRNAQKEWLEANILRTKLFSYLVLSKCFLFLCILCIQEKHLAANKPLHMAFIDLKKAFDRVPWDVIWWAMRKLGIDEWLVRLVQSMYKDVRSRVRVGDGYSEEFGVGVGVHQGSVLSPLLFIIVLEALSREFRTGCPWELLYADDLMISAESMEELLVKVQTWKTEMEKKGLRVNMGKTKIMESGINLDVLKKSGKYPCGVCQSGVGSSNAIFCGGCKRWVHKKCSGIKGPLRPDPEFRCTRCLQTAPAIDEREVSEVEVGNEKLEVVPEFCYLGDILSAGGGCELAAITRCKCAWGKFRQLLPLLTNRHLPLLTRGKVYTHVWGVWCCMQQRLGPWRWIHWTVSGIMTVPWSVGSAMSGQRTKLAQTPFSQSLASRTWRCSAPVGWDGLDM